MEKAISVFLVALIIMTTALGLNAIAELNDGRVHAVVKQLVK